MREFMLALDAGTSRWEAAVASAASSGDMEVESACIDGGPGSIPVLGFVTDDGDVVFGHEAERRGARAPDRLIRGFTREVGDGAPVIVGGFAVTPAELVARLARWVVDDVSARRGSVPKAVVLAHPAEWSGHRIAAVQAALRTVGLDDVMMMRAAIAAVHGHPPQASDGMTRTVLVYDLGGDGFRATVVQQDAERLRCVGEPVALPDVGGGDLDDALLAHVLRMAGADASGVLAPEDRVAMAELRAAVTVAKESLSSDADAAVPVRLASLETSVRITRSEFESMIDPMLERTLDATETAIDAAGLSPRALDAIVLVGGSSRIPLVAQRLSERFDRPLLAGDDPGATIALGAATAAGTYLLRTSAAAAAEDEPVVEDETAGDDAAEAPRRPRPALIPALSLGAAAVLVAGGLIFTATTPAGERADADDVVGSTPPHGALVPPRSGAFTGVVTPSEQDDAGGSSASRDSDRSDAREQETDAGVRDTGPRTTDRADAGAPHAGAPHTGTTDSALPPSAQTSGPAPVDAAPPGADPAPGPTTDPVPAPEPTTDPVPAPEPITDPAPAPEPTTDPAPAPEPTSDPAPAPEPESTSAPAPSPDPSGAAETPAP